MLPNTSHSSGLQWLSRAARDELGCEKYHFTYTSRAPSLWKRNLEVIRCGLKGVVRGEFVDSLGRIDELGDRWRFSKVSDSVRFHDVFYGVLVLNKGDDTHLSMAFALDLSSGRRWALQGIDFIDAFYARGPTAL